MICSAPEDPKQQVFDRVAAGARLDGIMSPLSHELAARFNLPIESIDMTLAWAWTPMDWECPGCGRGKREIARRTDKGKIMCRLVEHHDHMTDLVEEEFERQCKTHDNVVADEFAKRFAKRASQMVAAYDNTIICDDCNTVDPKAKRAAQTHPGFSYSPQEIRRFARIKPNCPHEIDLKLARAIWQEQAPTFFLRLKIIKRIAEIGATDSHWYQEVPRQQRAEQIYTNAADLAEYYGSRPARYELAGDKRQPVQDLSAWRMTIHMPPSRAPRPQDIDYVAKVTCAKAWNVVDDTWQCSCCKRSKLDTVRLSNKNQWTFNIFRPQFFEEPGRYDEKALVCQDCAKIATGIGREGCLALGIENENAYAQFLTADELALVVLPAPHRQHNISNNHADELIKIVIERIEAKQNITARNAAVAKDGDEI